MTYIAKHADSKGYIAYTADENKVWETLIKRQLTVIEDRACHRFLKGLKAIDFPLERIPQPKEVSETLTKLTNWSVKPVPAIIPLEYFFELLSQRIFPAASFIRRMEDLDYLEEPDIFHELFGHCPLLTDPTYADFMQWYGQIALSVDAHTRSYLGRLFWFTIEFGLMQTQQGIRIYGAGILSSFEETKFAVDSDEPKRLAFNLKTVINTDYRYDQIQKLYYVIDGFESLFNFKSDNFVDQIKRLIETDANEGHDFITC